ncbi:hypothetical protein E1A91_D05G083800v1 [Gossypium mustelinum]|uniref:Uncharacterized protein n=1 Tax=Gossypium mustelinum TaxID=34275 RepID=A0A5D2UVG1_GOSMU|nr:hypothetical protein E1A91_D05G083800v1 [Gossypium mustelinum]
MTRLLTKAPPVKRRTAALSISKDSKMAKKEKKCGEVMGVTAAECTAVCCCCPCSIIELLVLAFYKIPARLCKKVLRWKKRESTRFELEAELDHMMGKGEPCDCGVDNHDDSCARAVDFEQKMWDRFRGAGFWRSPSQREETPN